MLNISNITITERVKTENYAAFKEVNRLSFNKWLSYWLVGFFTLFVVILFVPWTQNIQAKGEVTTLRPEQRPQTIHSTIAGRVEKWYVQEGQFVKKGDTIVFLSEIKSEYFDPNLVERAQLQVKAKSAAVQSYEQKRKALDNQIVALRQTMTLKIEQTENKIRQSELKVLSDSLDLEAAITDFNIAQMQFERYENLFKQELISKTDYEKRQLKLQETKAKKISAENKLLSSRNDLLNAKIEMNSVKNQYADKIAKAESEQFSTLSNQYDAEASTAKLQSNFQSYSVRSNFYYITAPQDCYIVQALVTGVGETVKEGEKIVSIMPSDYELAVALYIEPMDLPLVRRGQNVQFIFDGWPAFAFSGWSQLSIGTFSGEVAAIDNVISKNGKYRVLVSPSDPTKPWPDALRAGSGAQGMAFLNDVPLWYELWRQLNGFPPNFYKGAGSVDDDKPKLKAPIKSLK